MNESKRNKNQQTVPKWLDPNKKYYRYDIHMKKPKRPLIAYELWAKHNIIDLKKGENVVKKQKQMWDTLKPEEKKVWEEKALKAKEKYNWNMEEYEYNRNRKKIETHGFNLMYGCNATSDSDSESNSEDSDTKSESDSEEQASKGNTNQQNIPKWLDPSKKYYRYDIHMKKPKRPLIAYELWAKHNIIDLKKGENDVKEQKQMWDTLKPEEKKVWEEKALKAKEKYNWNMEEYEYNRNRKKIETHGFNLMYGCNSTSDSDSETNSEDSNTEGESNSEKLVSSEHEN